MYILLDFIHISQQTYFPLFQLLLRSPLLQFSSQLTRDEYNRKALRNAIIDVFQMKYGEHLTLETNPHLHNAFLLHDLRTLVESALETELKLVKHKLRCQTIKLITLS